MAAGVCIFFSICALVAGAKIVLKSHQNTTKWVDKNFDYVTKFKIDSEINIFLAFLRSVQVKVRLHIFPIFSFLAKMKISEKYASGP